MSGYDGVLISELGAELYLEGRQALKASNISFFDNESVLARKWQECNFGCHTPAYRMLKKSSSWEDVLREIDKLSPAAAGFADGFKYELVDQPAKIAAGIERTTEGLHLQGAERFGLVGEENWATIELIQKVFTAMIEFDLNVFENPLMKTVLVVVNDYIAVLPEWVLAEVHQSGVFNESGQVDAVTLIKASKFLLQDSVTDEEIKIASEFVAGKAQRFIGKQVGKQVSRRLAATIALAVATKITRKLLEVDSEKMRLKRRLAALRSHARKAKGGLGSALVTLLKAQGQLGIAAKHSRDLKAKCPKTWHTLRYRLHGCDMVYFLLQPLLSEYVDRLSLLEHQPDEFLKVMRALIEARKTRQVFIPGSNY